ncbi:MAG: metal-dependent transcriptional regulator [Chloroflexi bacterium]|nr:metal-dependent transcriptional regulator [Chloroflexota bacterium]
MLTPVIESYLETIFNLTMEGDLVIAARLAEHFHVKPPTVSETLRRMVEHGYVVITGRRVISLTPLGQELAEAGLRRHRLLERFLSETLGLDWITSHEEAHRLEHDLSEDVEERIRKLLGDPETCPHGNPIPAPGRSPADFLRVRHAFRLSRTTAGQSVEVVCISEIVEDETALLRLLGSNRLFPETCLAIVENDGHRVHAIAHSAPIQLETDVTDKIWVRAVDPTN